MPASDQCYTRLAPRSGAIHFARVTASGLGKQDSQFSGDAGPPLYQLA